MISKEVLVTKNKINDKINSIIDFYAVWEHNHETKVCRLIITNYWRYLYGKR